MCPVFIRVEGSEWFSYFVLLAIPVGATLSLNFIWLVADTLNAFMAIPNLLGLLLLSPVVFALTREYFARKPSGKEVAAE